MSRLDENIAMADIINETINVFYDKPIGAELTKHVRESINTTVLLDISRSLAVIADVMSKEEESK